MKFLIAFILLIPTLIFSASDRPNQNNLAEINNSENTIESENNICQPEGSFINNVDNSKMLKVSGGEFIYGIDEADRKKIFNQINVQLNGVLNTEVVPSKKINLPTFYISQTEITNRQFIKFIDETKIEPPKAWLRKYAEYHLDYPVAYLGWKYARAYAQWAHATLPTEEQWEKAARGTMGNYWPWGNTPSGECYNGSYQGINRPTKVGTFQSGKSPYCLDDMAGNVYEMTTSLWVPPIDSGYVMRGGSYLNAGAYTMTVFRWSPKDTINGAGWLGFRIIMDSLQMQEMISNGKFNAN